MHRPGSEDPHRHYRKFSKVVLGFRNFGYEFLAVGEMFEGNSADMCGEKFPLMSMGGQAEGLACADPGARTPIGVSGNLKNNASLFSEFYSSER